MEIGFDVPFQGARNQPWHRDFPSPPETYEGRRITSLAFNLTGVDVTQDMGPFEIATGHPVRRRARLEARDVPARRRLAAVRRARRSEVPADGRHLLPVGADDPPRAPQHDSPIARPVLVLGVDAPGAGHAELHDMMVTPDFHDALPESVPPPSRLPRRRRARADHPEARHRGPRDGRRLSARRPSVAAARPRPTGTRRRLQARGWSRPPISSRRNRPVRIRRRFCPRPSAEEHRARPATRRSNPGCRARRSPPGTSRPAASHDRTRPEDAPRAPREARALIEYRATAASNELGSNRTVAMSSRRNVAPGTLARAARSARAEMSTPVTWNRCRERWAVGSPAPQPRSSTRSPSPRRVAPGRRPTVRGRDRHRCRAPREEPRGHCVIAAPSLRSSTLRALRSGL